ncbi:MAG: hypothetical protein M3T55_12140, partial [Pseudomonadota bacterium]|nr:hypothetical protein [Pseudomonadota bacterium]
AHLVLGRAAALTGGWAEAADAFTQALLLGADDDDGKLLLEHSAACARCGRLGEAVQSWKRARALAEDEAEPAARAIGAQTLLRGLAEAAHEVAADRGDWPGAWASLDALTELEDDSAAMEGRTQRLVKATAKALGQAADERDPRIFALAQLLIDHGRGDSRTRVILGRALSRERRHEEALTVWRALAAERPDSVEPHLQIARLAKRLDQADLGRRAADAVLALEPGHAEAGELRTLFDEAPSLG